MSKRRRLVLLVLAHLALVVFLANTSLLVSRPRRAPVLLAHRGIAQRFSTAGLRDDTCTAARMLPPVHGYLENTIPAIRAAFAAGADVVEIDVQPTRDGKFALFHDWTLDCRTEGHGVTREHTLAELQALDVGYGYTADGGKTFPFRGRGVGLLPSLAEVLAAFPERRFLLTMKSRDVREGAQLAEVLLRFPPERRAQYAVNGGEEPVEELRRRVSGVRTFTKSSLKGCLTHYLASGWHGGVPEDCRGRVVLVPVNVAPWLWGWPDRFLDRMERHKSEVFVAGAYHGGGFVSGIDTAEDLARLPDDYSGGIWTDDVATIGRAVRAQRSAGAGRNLPPPPP